MPHVDEEGMRNGDRLKTEQTDDSFGTDGDSQSADDIQKYDMDVLATPDLRLNKILLSMAGQWPHQSPVPKTIFYCLMLFFTSTQAYLQIAGMICAKKNIDLFLESIPTVLVDLTCAAKIYNFSHNGYKMKKLLTTLEDDWRTVKTASEIAILNKYSRFARKLTLIYCGALYGTMAPFLLIPLVPIIHNFKASENDSMPRQLMFEQVDYLLDTEKYYYPLFVHGYCGTLAFITVVVAIDTMFMVYVQHACAIFAIIGHFLSEVTSNFDIDIDLHPPFSNDKCYRATVDCVIKHQHALRYASLIEDANNVSYFFQLGINMICISFTGFQIVMKLEDSPAMSVRFAAFTASQMIILFLLSWPSQQLFDHSIGLSEFINHSRWYKTSLRTRKLFLLMIMRSRSPCQLSAGKFYILNLANFGSVIRTSMSYITVLLSMK